jgi:hypothetical protein
MKKETYYQRKKRENAETIKRYNEQIKILVTKPNSIEAMELRAIYQRIYDVEDMIWMGDSLSTHTGGIIRHIQA